MHLASYLGLLHKSELNLADAFRQVGDAHAAEPDVYRSGGLGLLRDLQDLYLMASECEIAWTVIGQAAQGARDSDLVEVVKACQPQTATQLKWLKTRMKQAAPQALVVAR
jgi:hypothetical protein